MFSKATHFTNSLYIGLGMPFFDGWCRYGPDRTDWMNSYTIKEERFCYEKCETINDCVAFSYDSNNVDEPCSIYRGGPYTHGNGRYNTRCYLMPKGKLQIYHDNRNY